MSTRCNIIVKDDERWNTDIQLYRHSDGYPEGDHGVIANLSRALEYAWPVPRMEADDFAAAIVRAWKEKGGNICIDGTADLPDSLHGDIAYYYVIEPGKDNWKVTVFEKSGKKLWQGKIGDAYPK